MIPLPFLKVFDIIPGWAYALIVAAVLAFGGVQTVRLAGSQTDMAELKMAAEKDRGDRLALVAAHNLKIGKMQADHAKIQQEIIGGYTDQILKLQGERTLAVARVDRVRNDAAAAAARDRATAGSDPAAAKRLADRNEVLYTLVAEGFDLVEQGRGILGERDAAVEALKSLIANDRKAICGREQQ
jgi:hypothetical protein